MQAKLEYYPKEDIRDETAFIKLVWFEQNVRAETKSMLWSTMVQAEDASSSRGCSFHPCLPACLSGAVLCKGKQREEEGVEHLGRNQARGQEKNVTSKTAKLLETKLSANGEF